jgi:long-chain acyl-CoA synthetase
MNKIGTIGKPINNVTVKIAEDGEILAKGPSNMLGYYKDQEKTNAVFENGYFKTGDLGRIDQDGFLHITGRKKESFKTSGGKYINPSKIEIELKKSKLIEQAMVIGESEKMPAAIIQPNFDYLQNWIKSKKISLEPSNIELIKNKSIIELIQKEINLVNEELGQWEKIKKFELTPDIWTTDSGHLTPTLKVKRDIIKTKYYILYNKIYRPFNG